MELFISFLPFMILLVSIIALVLYLWNLPIKSIRNHRKMELRLFQSSLRTDAAYSKEVFNTLEKK